jgi:hypothetical protein
LSDFVKVLSFISGNYWKFYELNYKK